MQDTAGGWTLHIRPRLGAMFWAHVAFAAGCLMLGALYARSTPAVLLLALLPAAWSSLTAWDLAHDVVLLRVDGDMGALGIERGKQDHWRTFRLEHLSTMDRRAMGGFGLAALWFLQFRAAGRFYGSDYFGPLEFVSYGSKVHFGGSLSDDVANAILGRVSAKVNVAVAPNKGIEQGAQG